MHPQGTDNTPSLAISFDPEGRAQSAFVCRMDRERYRKLCKEEDSMPLFSRDWWLDAACGKNRWDALLVEKNGGVASAMPLYSPLKGIVLMPVYTQTMGPWLAPEAPDAKYTHTLSKRQTILKVLVDALKDYPRFIQNFNYKITDWLPFYWDGYQQTTRYTYILNNIQDSAALWEGMSANIRRNITKARDRLGITVRKGIPTRDFIKIQTMTFQRQHLSAPKRPDRLSKLIAACRKHRQGDIWGAYDEEGRLHAVAFIAWQKSSAYYIAGGADPALRSSGAQSLLMWECIRFVSIYTSTFDFEGSMLPGVERFFREFGAIQTPYFTVTKGKISLLHRALIKLKELI